MFALRKHKLLHHSLITMQRGLQSTFLDVGVADQAHQPIGLDVRAPGAWLDCAAPVRGQVERRQCEDNIDVVLALEHLLVHCTHSIQSCSAGTCTSFGLVNTSGVARVRTFKGFLAAASDECVDQVREQLNTLLACCPHSASPGHATLSQLVAFNMNGNVQAKQLVPFPKTAGELARGHTCKVRHGSTFSALKAEGLLLC